MNQVQIARRIAQSSVLVLIAACSRADTIANLAPVADAIVVGSIPGRVDSAADVSFDITVYRVLKGESVPMVIHVVHAWQRRVLVPTTGPINVNVSFTGVWFLRRTSSAGWDVLAAHGPDGFFPDLFWPAVETLPASYDYSPGAPLLDKLVLEVGVGAKAGASPELMPDAIHSLNSAAVQTVLLDYLGSSSTRDVSAGLAGLLAGGQTGAITRLAQLWPVMGRDAGAKPDLLQTLSTGFRPQDPETVHEVAALAQAHTTPADLREALVKVLVAVHTREALPFLAGLLSGSDPAERAIGAFALSSFANGSPAQTRENGPSLAWLTGGTSPYQTAETVAHMGLRGPRTPEAEAEWLSFWAKWWNDHPELH
jgi:hypothetical protein